MLEKALFGFSYPHAVSAACHQNNMVCFIIVHLQNYMEVSLQWNLQSLIGHYYG